MRQFPMHEMETVLASFIAGWAVSVSFLGETKRRPNVEKLADLIVSHSVV